MANKRKRPSRPKQHAAKRTDDLAAARGTVGSIPGLPAALGRLRDSTTGQLAIISLAALLVYAGSYGVGWYLDDYPSIRDNPAIRDLGNWQAVLGFSPARLVSYFSFALNYAIHGYSLAGFHLGNNLVHVLAGVVVYLLGKALLACPAVQDKKLPYADYLPALGALLFLLHPLQSQAVVYIVQRSAALAALFYLLALLFYLHARLLYLRERELGSGASQSTAKWRIAGYAVAALLAAALAVLSKQNAVTLPLAILAAELCLFQWQGRKLATMIAVPGLLTALAGVISFLLVGPEFVAELADATSETSVVSRGSYLATQVGIVWEYIFRWFWPLQQQLDFDREPAALLSPTLWLGAIAHIAVLALAVVYRQRWPLLAFAVLFYYSAHLVESSIIPIRDFAFEHRTYLPNFGLALLSAAAILQFVPGRLRAPTWPGAVLGLLLLLGGLTVLRVAEWRDPPRFFANEIAANPQSSRPWSMLGEHYLRVGEDRLAAATFLEGFELLGSGFDRENNTVIAFFQNMILALDRVGRDGEAMALIAQQDLELFPPRNRSKMLSLRGNLIAQQGRPAAAEQDFREALRLDRGNGDARLSLAKVLFQQAKLDEAERYLLEFQQRHPFHPAAEEAETLLQAIPGARAQL